MSAGTDLSFQSKSFQSTIARWLCIFLLLQGYPLVALAESGITATPDPEVTEWVSEQWQPTAAWAQGLEQWLAGAALAVTGESTGETSENALPVRRIERRAPTQKASATAPVVPSSAVAPASLPRSAAQKSAAKAPAAEIVALSQSLGDSPAAIFRFVHDEINFDPKWGAGKSAVGTLQEREGTAWDQAWLLQQLLTAAGVDARLEWGEIEIPAAMLTNITGVEDPWRAGDLMTTAGTPIILVVEGSQVLSARMSHVWVKAHLSYIPNRGVTPGPGDTWVRMDPSLKRYTVDNGLRLDADVPFDLGQYLQSGTESSPRDVYETALNDFTAANHPGTTGLDPLKSLKNILQENFPFVPGSLRGKIVSTAGESTDLPLAFQQIVKIEVRESGGPVLLSYETPWPAVYGQRVELAWPGATSNDQSTLELFGGVFTTPPYEVELAPSLRINATEVALGNAIGSAEDVVVQATLTTPEGLVTAVPFEMFAGEHAVLGVDFGRTSQQTVDFFAQELAAATELDEQEGWALALANAQYLRDLRGDLDHLAALRWQRALTLGTVVLAVQRGAVSTTAGGAPSTFSRGPVALDLGAMPLGLFPAQGDTTDTSVGVATLELLGSQGSFRESEALSQAFAGDHVSAVTFLTRAVRDGQTLTRVDLTNLDDALAAANLGNEAEANVRAGVEAGQIAWISENQLLVDTFDTAGYVLEDPANGAGGYFVTYQRLVQGANIDITIHSPADGAVVTAPTDVIASIESEELANWSLRYQAVGGNTVAVAAGTEGVINGTVGVFDPTMLVNGLYDIVLTGQDIAGQNVNARISVVVDSGMKIGDFVLPLLDLGVPVVGGVPFEVARIYDSKDRGPNDFGHGWRMHLSEYEVIENTSPGRNWRGTVEEGLIPTYCIEPARTHLVVVRFPDGSLARYEPRLEPRCQIIAPPQVVTLTYHPVAGTRTQLEPLDIRGEDLIVAGAFPGPIELWELDTGLPHNPQTYRFTTGSGAMLDIDEFDGLQRIEDTNGNVIDVSPDGLLHSRGVGMNFERDSEGRIFRITDPNGAVLRYEYDANGDLVSFFDRIGQEWQYTYGDDHYLESIIDPNGRVLAAIGYDGDNRWKDYCEGDRCVEAVHEISLGRETFRDGPNEAVMEYDSKGNVTRMINQQGHITDYEYNDNGELIRQINPDGGVLQMKYNDEGRLIERIAPHPEDEPDEWFTTKYTPHPNGQVARVDFPTGAALVMEYDNKGNLTRQEDADGNLLFARTYGPDGVVTSDTGRFGTIIYEDFTSHGKPRKVTDPFGVVTTYTYDANGNATSVSDPYLSGLVTFDDKDRDVNMTFSDGVSITSTYGIDDMPLVVESTTGERHERLLNTAGQVRGVEFTGGVQVDYSYNSDGLLSKMSQPIGDTELDIEASKVQSRTDVRGNTVNFEYDSMGRITQQTNSLGHTVRQTVDEANRVRSMTNERNKTWLMSYEPNKTIITDPLNRTEELEFNSHGLPLRLRRANGAVQEITYLHTDPYADPESTPATLTDIGGRTISYGYNSHGHPILYTNHNQEEYTMTWNDRLGVLTSVTGPAGNSRGFSYDTLGRLEVVTFGDGGTLGFTYDAGGRIQTKTRPSGTRFDFTYDAAFNNTGWTTTAGESVGMVWNTAAQLTSTTDATGTTSYGYDGPDLETITNADGSVMTYDHDVLGRLKSVTVTAGAHTQSTTYGYDEVGNLTSVIDPNNLETTMTYDDVNRLESRTLPNGIRTEYAYNLVDQMTGVTHYDANGNVLRSLTYERQGIGEPTRITREDGSYRTFTYDDNLRVQNESYYDAADVLIESIDYTYDPAGNRETRVTAAGTETYAYDTGNRLASVTGPLGTETYTHDADGRITAINRGGVSRTLEYDSLDLLTTVRDGGTAVASFNYDAVGRRVGTGETSAGRKVTVGPLTDPVRVQSHLVRAADDSVVAGYAFAHEKPLMRTTPTGSVYYLTDAKGSVIALTDETGQIVADFDYDSFGNMRSSSGPAAALDAQVGGDFRFHGEWLDEATSFYFLRARHYDPQTGRFLSRDSAEVSEREPESLNAYIFANSNPHVYSDPLGLFAIAEVNITNVIQNVLASIQLNLQRFALREARGFAADQAMNFLRHLLESQLGPISGNIERMISRVRGNDAQGLTFEAVLTDMMCHVLYNVPGYEVVQNYLYLEVPMKKNGDALNNGLFQCTPNGVTELNKMKNPPSNPDYLLAFNPPEENSRSTLLVGDIKRAASLIESHKTQFKTMVKHAERRGFFTVLYIALFRDTGPGATSTHRRTAPVVQIFVLSLFGGNKRVR